MSTDRDLTSELRHRQQRRRATTTILVALLALFFAFWYAFSYYRSSTAEAGKPTATCRPYNAKEASPANTTVNVYNASTKTGLAQRTANELKRRGYVIGDISNDPLKRKVSAPAEVRFGSTGAGHAKLIVPLGGTGTTQVQDKRKGTTIDLVLGAKFTALAPAPKATGKPMCAAPTPTATSASAS